MNLIVSETLKLEGEVVAPRSKSHSIRAIIISSLFCSGESILRNILQSDDTHDAITACRQLGAIIDESNNCLNITGAGLPLKSTVSVVNSGNSGLTTHFILPILGLRESSDYPVVLNCHEQMRSRPVVPLIDALRKLGLTIQFIGDKNSLPVSITGELLGGRTYIDGITSQYLSSLLLALPCAPSDSVIIVENLKERPYVDMTLRWLQNQHIHFSHHSRGNVDIYSVFGRQTYHAFQANIPTDYSSLAYILAAAVLIPGEVILNGVQYDETQGDKKMIDILKEMGADIHVNQSCLKIKGGRKLIGMKIDARDIPDLLPALAVVGTYATDSTQIYGVAHARIKETDRIHSMIDGLSKLGARIESNKDSLTVHQSDLSGGNVDGYADHRTVMALSIAGMLSNGTTTIKGCEAINKTFPDFVSVFQSIGGKMEYEKCQPYKVT